MNAVGEYAVNRYGLIKMTKAPKGFRDPVIASKPPSAANLKTASIKKEDKSLDVAVEALKKMSISGNS